MSWSLLIVLLLVLLLVLLVAVYALLQHVQAELRAERRLRTAVSTVYGMALTLHLYGGELPLSVRLQLYEVIADAAGAALQQLDGRLPLPLLDEVNERTPRRVFDVESDGGG